MSGTVQQIHVGRWRIPGCEGTIDGTLTHDAASRSLSLELIQDMNVSNLLLTMAHAAWIPIVTGHLLSGESITLINCWHQNTCISENAREARCITVFINVSYAFVGLSDDAAIPSAPSFMGCVFDYGEVIQWMKICSFDWMPFYLDRSSGFKWAHSDVVRVSMPSGLSIEFIPTIGTVSQNNYNVKHSIEQHVKVRLSYDTQMAWRDILSDAEWLQLFIELGKGTAVNLYDAKYLHASRLWSGTEEHTEVDCFEPGDVLLGNGSNSTVIELEERPSFLFDLPKAIETGVLCRWFELRESLEPIVRNYERVYSESVHSVTALFLNLMQALELIHKRFVHNGPEDSEYMKLNKRLRHLLSAENECPVSFDFLGAKDVAELLAETRNYYTHYNSEKRDIAIMIELIPSVNWNLKGLCEYYLMRILGFDSGFAGNQVRDRLEGTINTCWEG